MNRFDANDQPLSPGLRLLEASAGTGKTFALAHLMLRLVAEKGWGLRQLLVVTFTEAAAAELRDRIGRRLQEGLAGLETPQHPPSDAVLATWLERQRGPEGPGLDLLRGRLLLALEELDAADITTIHGFCLRTLQRQALEAGRPPELQLESSGDTLVHQVAHDYWQQQVLALPVALVAGLKQRGLSPEAITNLLRSLDGDPALALDPLPAELEGDGDSMHLPEGMALLWAERWQRFRREWAAGGRELHAEFQLEAARWKEQGHPKTTPYAAKPRRDRCAEIEAWIAAQPAEGDYEAVLQQSLLKDFFHPGAFTKVARQAPDQGEGSVRLPGQPLLEAVAGLVDEPSEAVLLHACHWGRQELQRRRARSGVSSFSQLLRDLDPGPGCNVPTPLLAAVGRRYRAALIDEFQDTDPIQWRILRLAFGGGEHPLVMVGDPKQAIYRFRGGDLATYLAARELADERYDLIENRRSTPALIAGLNKLMAGGLRRSRLEVPPVEPKAERSGPDPGAAPIELLWLGDAGEAAATTGQVSLPSKTGLEARLAPAIALDVEQLLGRGLVLHRGERHDPLRPEDLCLLVNDHRQAEQLRAALERRGIATRLVSRADVFASAAATALQRFLDALADPADANRLRLLAATPLLGWSAAAITTSTPEQWNELAGRMDTMARQLQRRGLLGLLGELVGAEGTARLARGGRLLADLQQVAELVQERLHADQLAADAAADWLRRLRHDPDRAIPEEHQAHSDRADGAVSVVTIHRSKGLEYPVVICPYLWLSARGGGERGRRQRLERRWQPPHSATPVLDLHLDRRWGTGEAADRQSRNAEEQERERLAYVAATRAQHLLVLVWGPARGHQCAPLFPWLFAAEPLPDLDEERLAQRSPAQWRQQLEAGLAARGLPIRLRDLPLAPSGAGETAAPGKAGVGEQLETGPVPARALDSAWGRSSYTSWTHAASVTASVGTAPAALETGRDTLDPSPESPAETGDVATGWNEQGPLASFPRGAAAGDCLHRILERLEFGTSLEASPEARTVVERELRRAGMQQEPLEPVLEGLERMRTTPFGGPLGALRLADLPAGERLHEMNFDLTLGFARGERLAAAFADHPGGAFGRDYADRLAQLPIASRGFLTGSIDLVFRAASLEGDQRWWVADWKSNWLGSRDADGRPLACGPRHYSQTAMTTLMADSHYPLQAHLYLVALHRYLGWRLGDYEPQRHLGGYAYVFLRGTPGPEGQRALPGAVPGMVVECPPLERLLALDRALGRLEAS
jgi:exodeoxyribonuclease V beta subunit